MTKKKNVSLGSRTATSQKTSGAVSKTKVGSVKAPSRKVAATKTTKATSKPTKTSKSNILPLEEIKSAKVLKSTRSTTALSSRADSDLQIVQFYQQVQDKKQCEALWTAEAMGSVTNTWEAIDAWHDRHQLTTKLWGVAPRQFAQLTGISAAAWNQGVLANPGRDIYFCNPLPAEEAIYPNPYTRWLAEVPSAAAVWQALMTDLGQPQWTQAYWPSGTFMVPHFWVAKPSFIVAYRDFVNQSMSRLEKVYSKRATQNWHQPGVWPAYPQESLYSLMAAYLLPVFLRTPQGQTFKAFKIVLPQAEARLNAHLRSLRSLKDAAISGRSVWLAQVWLNYRNLYLLQVQGQRWCDRYLRSITPNAIHLLDMGTKSTM